MLAWGLTLLALVFGSLATWVLLSVWMERPQASHEEPPLDPVGVELPERLALRCGMCGSVKFVPVHSRHRDAIAYHCRRCGVASLDVRGGETLEIA